MKDKRRLRNPSQNREHKGGMTTKLQQGVLAEILEQKGAIRERLEEFQNRLEFS